MITSPVKNIRQPPPSPADGRFAMALRRAKTALAGALLALGPAFLAPRSLRNAGEPWKVDESSLGGRESMGCNDLNGKWMKMDGSRWKWIGME